MYFTQSEQYESLVKGQNGRPDHYPVPEDTPELLFYIQRSKNTNTVIYESNINSDGLLDLNEPIKISWISFENPDQTNKKELNYIQEKLAYGYKFEVISPELIRVRFVAYDNIEIFMARVGKRFRVFMSSGTDRTQIDMIYIYAEDLGVFPLVKFAEFFGKNAVTGDKYYKKLIF